MTDISKEQFTSQRSPRRGEANPEKFDSPVWRWLVESELSAHQAREQFDGPGPFDEGWTGPGWCFDRMGCSKTELPDGRVVRIAGEHEDSYDPDFYIYNDVVVKHPDGPIDIYGYPEDVFPGTDFHSATFDEARNCIWVVGNLGHDEHRRQGETPVYRICASSFHIAAAATTGELPGWIHGHTAELTEGGAGLRIHRGVRQHDNGELIDQTDDWFLDLETLVWRRETCRAFRQWSVRRVDGGDLKLLEMSSLAFDLRYGGGGDQQSMFAELGLDESVVAELNASQAEARSEIRERFDPEVYESLYQPPVAFTAGIDHDEVPGEDLDEDLDDWSDNTRFDRESLLIGDCRVRYAEERDSIKIKVEGDLDPGLASTVRADLIAKLAQLQGVPCEAQLEWEQ